MPLTSALCHWRTALLLTTAYLGSLFYSPGAAQPGWDLSDSVNAAGISQSSHSSTTKKKDSAKSESSKTDSSKKKTSSKSDSSKEKSSKGSDTKTDSAKKASTDKKKETEKGKSAQSKKDGESKKTEASKSSSKSSSKESEKKKTDSSKTDSKKNDAKKSDAKKNDSDSKAKTENADKKPDASKPEAKPEEKPQEPDKPQEPAPQQVIVTSTETQKDTRNIAVEVVSSTMEHAADAGKSGLKSIINLPKALAGGAMRLTETFIKTGRSQTGTASFYGSDWHGQKTASGETFDMNTLTAAHRTLPFNTHVLVTNLRNGKQTVVRINNRGPFSGGRIIDLSRAAAEKIGMLGSGVAPVKLEILKR